MGQKKGNGWAKKAVSLILTGSLLAGGSVLAYRILAQQDIFNADGYATDAALHNNQVVFDGKDDYTNPGAGNENSNVWEQDQAAQDKLNANDRPDASYLFAQDKQLLTENPDAANVIAQINPQASEQMPANTPAPADPTPQPQNIVVVKQQEPENPDDEEQNTPTENGGDSGDNGGGAGDNGNGGTGGLPTLAPTLQPTAKPTAVPTAVPTEHPEPSATAKPTRAPTTAPTQQPTAAPTTQPTPTAQPTPQPTPVVNDPDPVVPTDDPMPGEYPTPMPTDGVTPQPDKEPYAVQFYVLAGRFMENSYKLYAGEELSAWKLFCASYSYINIDWSSNPMDSTLYRLMDYPSDYLRVGTFPQYAPKGDFEVTFYGRLNKDSDWMESKATFYGYDAYVLMTAPEELDLSTLSVSFPMEFYLDDGETIDMREMSLKLFTDEQLYGVFDEETFDVIQPRLTLLPAGWSELPNGKPVGNSYTPTTTRTVLYALPMIQVPEAYQLYFEYNWDLGHGKYITMTGCEPELEVLDVPQAVECVNLSYTARKMNLPASVLDVQTGRLQLEDGYAVEAGNPNYSAQDGMLLNAEGTVLYAVPGLGELDIPAGVKTLDCANWASSDGKPRTVVIQSDTLPTLDVTTLENLTLTVPEALYYDAVAAWGTKLPDGVTLVANAPETPETVVEHGAVYTKDRKTLLRVLDEAGSLFVVPNTVTTLADGATKNCTALTTLVLPDSVTEIGSGALAGGRLKTVLMQGQKPPETVAEDCFAPTATLKMKIPTGTAEDYRSVFAPALAAAAGVQLVESGDAIVDEGNGFSYLNSTEGAILLTAPADLIRFDETTLPGVGLTQIGEGAFRDCKALTLVILPEAIDTIGANAFAGCDVLEGVLSENTAEIHVGDQAFEAGGNVRFVALNALSASFENDYGPSAATFVPAGAVGYPEGTQPYSYCYWVEDQNEGTILYGDATEDYENEFAEERGAGCYILRATSMISGEVAIPDGWLLTEIADEAFYECPWPFTIGDWGEVWYIGTNAFMWSGLTGEVNLPELQALDGTLAMSIGTRAFYACADVTAVSLPSSVISIEGMAFASCWSLSRVYIDGRFLMDSWSSTALGGQIFSDCLSLSSVTFGEECALSSIPEGMFYGDLALKEFVCPASVTEIRPGCFDGSGLERLTMEGAEPASLVCYSAWPDLFPFSFGNMIHDVEENPEGVDNGFLLEVPQGCEAAYIDSWKRPLLGRSDYATLTDEEELEGQNLVRKLLGMELLDSLPTEEGGEPTPTPAPDPTPSPEPELPELPEGPADVTTVDGEPVEPSPAPAPVEQPEQTATPETAEAAKESNDVRRNST